MKKILAIAMLALWTLGMQAMPAKPGFRTYTQPDGKTLTLQLKGDEWGSWFETASGVRYTMDSKGYFHQMSEAAAKRTMEAMALKRRTANGLRDVPFKDMTHGTRHIPVVLVQFSDVKFKIDNPVESFNALLNEKGYNGYKNSGATGSVKDYYLDNSHGAFDPVFDVLPVATLSQPIAYYGAQVLNEDGSVKANDKQPEIALYDACLILDRSVDFSQYDYNKDGLIDMVLFYYAGNYCKMQ